MSVTCLPHNKPLRKTTTEWFSVQVLRQPLRVRHTLQCLECDQPHILHAARKLKVMEISQLDRPLEGVHYTCSMVLGDYVEDSGSGPEPEILSKIFVRQDLRCSMPVEIPHYSSAAFPLVCCYCTPGQNLATGEAARDIYPTCKDCLENRPQLFKCKPQAL